MVFVSGSKVNQSAKWHRSCDIVISGVEVKFSNLVLSILASKLFAEPRLSRSSHPAKPTALLHHQSHSSFANITTMSESDGAIKVRQGPLVPVPRAWRYEGVAAWRETSPRTHRHDARNSNRANTHPTFGTPQRHAATGQVLPSFSLSWHVAACRAARCAAGSSHDALAQLTWRAGR